MLFYNFESLDNFINNELIKNIIFETKRLDLLKELYESKKVDFLTLTTNAISIFSDAVSKKQIKEFYKTVDLLKSAFEHIDDVNKLIGISKTILINITSLHDKNIENNYNEIKAELIEYNKISDELSNKIYEFENTSTSALIDIFKYFTNTKIDNKHKYLSPNITNNNSLIKNIETSSEDNNILVISEKDQMAYLPYKFNTVKRIFKNSDNKYQTLQDVVNDLYILPLKNFKNSPMSRFKEAYNLIKNKENGSIAKALDLGLELIFKHELNPIIIAACRNIDELDIYLDCLDKNELDDFKCFDIKFEVSPKKV